MSSFPKTPLYFLVIVATTALFAYRVYIDGLYAEWRHWVPVLFWFLGGILGYLVLGFDRLVDIFITNPERKLSLYVRDYISRAKYWEAWQLLSHNKHLQTRLTFRSIVFQGAWIILALFTITSTTSLFGKAFVLGLGLHLLLDEWEDYLKDKIFIKKWLFWQVTREISDQELRMYLWIMTLVTTVFFLVVLYQ